MTDSSAERKLDNISEQVSALQSSQATAIVGADVRDRLGVLSRRLGEYRNGSFIVLVVGAVKSGKSTLVNLLSHCYVSPTDKLECTVRPSIVSGGVRESEQSISVYRSRTQGNQSSDLDLVIDGLRGLVGSDEVDATLDRTVFPLSADNIDRVVFPTFNRVDDTLITAITVADSPLLSVEEGRSGQVFLVDMPGFDGSNTNYIDDSRYDAMSRRVDLILFVHSSVSAFNVTASQYLDSLREHNGGAPVVLVHNVFDSMHWRDGDSLAADVERQLAVEMDEIARKGFNIKREHCYAIDLGMVSDYVSGNYRADCKERLEAEATRFATAEVALRDMITSNISDMRVTRCLKRSQLMRDHLVTSLDAEVVALETQLEQRRKVDAQLATLRVDCAMPPLEVTKLTIDARDVALQAISVIDVAISGCSQSMNRSSSVAWLERLASEYFELLNHDVSARVLSWYKQRVAEYVAGLSSAAGPVLPVPVLVSQPVSLLKSFLPDGVEQFVPAQSMVDKILHRNFNADALCDMARALRAHLLVESRFNLRVAAAVETLATTYVDMLEQHYNAAQATLATSDVADRHEALITLRNNLQDILFT